MTVTYVVLDAEELNVVVGCSVGAEDEPLATCVAFDVTVPLLPGLLLLICALTIS